MLQFYRPVTRQLGSDPLDGSLVARVIALRRGPHIHAGRQVELIEIFFSLIDLSGQAQLVARTLEMRTLCA